jgi:methylated-DNA-[protein]-cysteine S-methyltransferase
MKKPSSDFNERCYEVLKRVPKGKVTTYGEIAKALNTTACRAVGSAMAKNENLFVIPCHRVIRSNGQVGDYALGSEKKAELLMQEGVTVTNGKVKELNRFLHRLSG